MNQLKEIYIIERMLGPGAWEVFGDAFYTDPNEASRVLKSYYEFSDKQKLNWVHRITTLKSPEALSEEENERKNARVRS